MWVMLRSLLWVVLVGCYTTLSLAGQYEEGTHYKRVDARAVIPRKAGEKPVVEEMFWYGCPHCHHLEPTIAAWAEAHKHQINFTPIPVFFGEQWKAHAKLFYTLEALGFERTVRAAIFNALGNGQSLSNVNAMTAYLSPYLKKNHVTPEQFKATYNSYGVLAHMKIAAQKTKLYKLVGVPAFVVNGTYMTNVTMAGSEQNLLKVLDQLIAQK